MNKEKDGAAHRARKSDGAAPDVVSPKRPSSGRESMRALTHASGGSGGGSNGRIPVRRSSIGGGFTVREAKTAQGIAERASRSASPNGSGSARSRSNSPLEAVIRRSSQLVERHAANGRYSDRISEFEENERLAAWEEARTLRECQLALQQEKELTSKLRRDNETERRNCSDLERKLDEMASLLTVTSALAERSEQDCLAATSEAKRLSQLLSSAQREIASLSETLDEHRRAATKAKSEAGDSKANLLRLRNTAREEIDALVAERDSATRRCEELLSDLAAMEKKHCAETDLVRAQSQHARRGLESQLDEVTAQLADVSMSLSDAVAALEAAKGRINVLESDAQSAAQRFQVRVAQVEAACAERIADAEKKLKHFQANESTFEHHIDVLLARTASLQATIEASEKLKSKLEAELAHEKDINHELAIRLKAATADREASVMEAETRRILTRQNDEMERQLSEMRRTISDLVKRK